MTYFHQPGMTIFHLREKSKATLLPGNGRPHSLAGGLQSQGSSTGQILWWLLLVIEVFIYSSYSILVHLCLIDGKLPFRSWSVVFCIEVTKILLSGVMIWPEVYAGQIKMPSVSACLPFTIPAVLYSINNNLSVNMQSHMDPTTYQILGNLKVVSTGILYRIIMKRLMNPQQWFALGLLALAGMCDSYGGLQSKGENWIGQIHVTVTGLCMMGIYCCISGFAGVYTEYILKQQYQTSLHLQNILLYMFGILCNGGMWLVQEFMSRKASDEISSLFEGFSMYTWIIIVTQALNGLIMSAVMKHSSNITRLFIISFAMLLTTVFSVVLFHLALSIYYVIAFLMVVCALYLYK